MRLFALLPLAFVALSGCSTILSNDSAYCGREVEVNHYPSHPIYSAEAVVASDGFEWSSDSGPACSEQHVNAEVSLRTTAPTQGCAAITGIEARLQAAGGFRYGPYPGSDLPIGDGKTTWRASVTKAGLAQGKAESDSVTFTVSLRALYPMTGNDAADGACVDKQLEEARIAYSYKSYKP